MLIFYILFFVFGTIVGSFLNSVIYRLHKKESILKKRSYCPYCKKKLSWYELIPILSFLLQGGKCRNCNKKISWQYPLVEFFTGLVFVLITIYFFNFSLPPVVNTCFLLLASCFLIIIFVYDLKHYIIPNKVIYPAISIALLYSIYLSIINNSAYGGPAVGWQLPIINNLLSAVVAGGFFFLLIVISKGRWMGMGDVKMALFMGLVLGWPGILLAFLISFLIGGLVALALVFSGEKTLKNQIPLGPFLVIGTFIAVFLGDKLIRWLFLF